MEYYELDIADVDEWTETSNSFVPMDHRYREPERWQVAMTVQQTTAYRLLRWDQPGDRLAFRTPSNIRRASAEDFYWVVFPQRGEFAAADEHGITRITPGQAAVVALDRPCRLHIPSSVAYGFEVPRAEFARPGLRRPVLDLGSGLGRIAAGMIRDLHAEQSALTTREFNAVCDRIAELLCLMTAGDTHPQQTHLTELAETVRQYVRQHIGAADLRLPEAARALGWSPRQLRAALHEAGTTYREVRQDEALRAARTMLANPETTATIGEVAARSGFTLTWFSAAFKARYGETPREFRKRRLAESQATRTDGDSRGIAVPSAGDRSARQRAAGS